jgi:multiple sugar transport system permease protein
MITMLAYPTLMNFYMSFFDWPLVGGGPSFIGLGNYQAAVLTDFRAVTAIKNTIVFTATAVTMEFLLGLGTALLLQVSMKGSRIIRSVTFAPMMVTPIVVGLMWRFMWDTDFGTVNFFLSLFGIPVGTINWLGDPSTAMLACVLTEVWQNTPLVTLILLAGLESLPAEPFQAARLDGASKLQTFMYVTLPLLKSSIMVALLFRTMFTIRIFDTIYALTHGGPADATSVLSLLIYITSFGYWRAGYSAALAWILFAITAAISSVYLATLYREVKV